MKTQAQPNVVNEPQPVSRVDRAWPAASEPLPAPVPHLDPAAAVRILVAVDLSSDSHALVRRAALLARQLHGRVTLAYVQPRDWFEEEADGALGAHFNRDLQDAAHAKLRQLGEDSIDGCIEFQTEFRVGKWAPTLVKLAHDLSADLVVAMAPERPSLPSWWRADPLDRLVQRAPCPVAVIPGRILHDRLRLGLAARQILVAAGPSEAARRALRHAAALALRLNLQLIAMHALSYRGAGSRLDFQGNALNRHKQRAEAARREILQHLAAERAAGLSVKVIVRAGYPAARVVSRQLQRVHPELAVLGASFESRFGGNCLRAALRSAAAPILLVGPACRAESSAVLGPVGGEPRAPAQARSSRRGRSGDKRVLLLEEDAAVRESIAELLAKEHCSVTAAASGEDVAKAVNPEQLDLAILDLKERDHRGWSALRHLRAANPRLPVVVIGHESGRADQPPPEGVNALLEKPLDVPELLQTVHGLLRQPAPTGALSPTDPAGPPHRQS